LPELIGDKYVLIQKDGKHAKVRFFNKLKEMNEFPPSPLTHIYGETSKFSAKQCGNCYYITDALYLGLGKGDFSLKEDNEFFIIEEKYQHDYFLRPTANSDKYSNAFFQKAL